MNTLLLIALLCYNTVIQQSGRQERVNAHAGLNTEAIKEPRMPDATLPAPSALVQIPNGDPGVTYREVVGFPGYAIGDNGALWSRRGPRGTWKRRRTMIGHDGREHAVLCINWKKTSKKIHHLVLEAFVGPCPDGLEACHWDDNPLNNSIGNLRWDTHEANMADRERNGKQPRGERHGMAILTSADVAHIKAMVCAGCCRKCIQEQFSVSQVNVSQIALGKIWGFIEPSESLPKAARCKLHSSRWTTDQEKAYISSAIQSGAPVTDIAEAIGVSTATVRLIAKKLGAAHPVGKRPGRWQRGDAHYSCKTTPELVATIQERLANGERPASIARATGLSSGTILNIKHGRHYSVRRGADV